MDNVYFMSVSYILISITFPGLYIAYQVDTCMCEFQITDFVYTLGGTKSFKVN
jgi:hypothetical protein